ncbi:FMN-dependent NADH-azoreductase [Planosporangium flavigriseum]|uniref:FMN dependent NADH:quinone oxidoreductase n=1 Tax=Planosporangium flavigriseum TaxID=373681 RepID=A0A8J3LJ11_9ACTN|nr:NAD(P)H-dependent oxidoreductase [Planosporangium flavigriseum]GIG73737.1 FMN-dependent NADH-azoreductase [Planosporangium flavigriseum]
MTLFRLDASVRTDGSFSRQVADTVQAAWQAERPDASVIRRDLGAQPLPARAWMSLVGGASTPAERDDARALAASLADELLEADSYLFAVPLYNYGVPQHVKTWLDLLIADPRLGPGGEQPLTGRPAVLVVVRGGGYGPGTPREGWDHATPYLKRIFADVFGLDLEVVAAELTLAPVVPAMEELRGLAEQSLREAHEAARAHGQAIATRAAASV